MGFTDKWRNTRKNIGVVLDEVEAETIHCPASHDGKPIKPGQVLYGQDGKPWVVRAIGDGHYPVWASNEDGNERQLKPEWLSTNPYLTPSEVADKLDGIVCGFSCQDFVLVNVAELRSLAGDLRNGAGK